MKKFTKEGLMEEVESRSAYKFALKSVSKEQQTRIRAILEAFMTNAAKMMAPLAERLENDPKYAGQLRDELKKERNPNADEKVVIPKDDDPTGSKGS